MRELYLAGASSVMLGSMLMATDESPGQLYIDEKGARYNIGRGSASSEASQAFARASGKKARNRAPQGVSGVRMPYKGSVHPMLEHMKDAIQQGIANSGADSIQGLRNNGRIDRLTNAAIHEGKPHIKQ